MVEDMTVEEVNDLLLEDTDYNETPFLLTKDSTGNINCWLIKIKELYKKGKLIFNCNNGMRISLDTERIILKANKTASFFKPSDDILISCPSYR